MKTRATAVIAVMLALAAASLAAQPVITNQPASRAVWAGGNVRFAVGVSGAGPFTYQWQLNTTNLPNGIITTVAGNGTQAYFGNGGAAINASLDDPTSVAFDPAGNLFIADNDNQRIRVVSTNGIITTVAGNGMAGYSGDGGAATSASFAYPTSVAVDPAGNFFIADQYNSRIREVGTNGIITTVAGTGAQGYSGDGGPATNANLLLPQGVAVDASGNLFIADTMNNRVRKVSANGVITRAAGIAAAGYSGDGGAATNANLNGTFGVALDAAGNLFIADHWNNRIRKVSTNGIITTVAGNGVGAPGGGAYSGDGGAATNASLFYPYGVAVDACGNLFIADNRNNRIRKVSTNGIIATVAGNGAGAPGGGAYSGDGGAATNASLYSPSGVAADASGNLFIADSFNNVIRKVTNTQGPALALNSVNSGNAGNYQVVVTGPGGSVTSSIATLIVATSPIIYGTVLNTDGSVTLSLISQPNSTNVVQCATNLSPPVFWQSVSTNVAGGDGNWQFTDTNAPSYQTRFYRSLMP